MAYINWNIAAELIESDGRVSDIVESLRGVNRSSLNGLTTLYSKIDEYRRQSKGRVTIHGCGFVLREKDEKSDEIWLTVSGCWSGSWQIRVLVGTSPFGFGATGTEVARLELSKPKYDKAMQLLNAPWSGVDKDALMAKHGHKLKKSVVSVA